MSWKDIFDTTKIYWAKSVLAFPFNAGNPSSICFFFVTSRTCIPNVINIHSLSFAKQNLIYGFEGWILYEYIFYYSFLKAKCR